LIEITLNKKLKPFVTNKSRYKVAYGGRGSSKSWTVARILLIKAMQQPLRILCTREIQDSIKDSVHKLLKDQIRLLGLAGYTVQNDVIKHVNGSEFLFKGLYSNLSKIKSFEGVDICWVEEAEAISEKSWEILIPTIRKNGSEIWVTFNPYLETDPTYKRFILNPPPNAIIKKVNWSDNPYFPKELKEEKDYIKEVDYDLYLHIWEGHCKTASDAQIFRGKFVVEDFNVHKIAKEKNLSIEFYFGLDWGFSQDPLRQW